MDRGTRRAQKARIRTRLRRVFENAVHDEEQRAHSYARVISPCEIEKLRRRIYRNEGKPVVQFGCFIRYYEESKYRNDSRRTRTLREAERMKQDERQWRLLERGE